MKLFIQTVLSAIFTTFFTQGAPPLLIAHPSKYVETGKYLSLICAADNANGQIVITKNGYSIAECSDATAETENTKCGAQNMEYVFLVDQSDFSVQFLCIANSEESNELELTPFGECFCETKS